MLTRRTPFFLAALGVAIVGLAPAVGAATKGHTAPSRNVVLFRQVLCYVPTYVKTVAPVTTVTAASCSPGNTLTAANLGFKPNVSPRVVTAKPEPALAGTPSTKAKSDNPSAVELLPGLVTKGKGAKRYLCGLALMSNTSVASASVTKGSNGQWLVDFTFAKTGASRWNTVNRDDFHQVLAVDVNGVVVTAPIVEPQQATFSASSGSVQLSGNFSSSEAQKIATALTKP